MKKIKTNESPFEKLPLAIMLDIFSRLLTKSCLYCKLVCKEWYQMIISNEFADLRPLSHSRATMVLYGKLFNNKYDFVLVDLDNSESLKIEVNGNLILSSDAMIRFKTNFSIFKGKLNVVNECNGLLCLTTSYPLEPYLVCNLLTGEQVIVKQYWIKSCKAECFGLGYCSVSRQFKVVRLQKITARGEFDDKFEAVIQTLGTNEWRTIVGDVPQRIYPYKRSCSVFLHGSLHMKSHRDKFIWSFDFGSERFVQVPTPDGRETTLSSISVFDSCLCFTSSPCFGPCEIWLMKEYGVKASWVKQFVIQQPQPCLYPLMPILQMGTRAMLASYDSQKLFSCVAADDVVLRRPELVKFHGTWSFVSLAPFNTKFSKIGAATPVEVKPKRARKAVSYTCTFN